MDSLNSIKKEIKSTNDLLQNVSTMKILAAANIKKYEKIVFNLQKYQSNVNLGLQAILKQHPNILNYIKYTENFYKNENLGESILVVIGSNQGLCGRFNDRIVDYFIENIKNENDKCIITIGDRINMLVEAKKLLINHHLSIPNSTKQINELVYKIFEVIENKLLQNNLKKVLIFYTNYEGNNKSSLNLIRKKVLPLETKYFEKLMDKQWLTNKIPYWRIETKKIAADFVQQYIFASISMSITSSMAAEQFSRLTTLQRSEENIKNKIDELTKQYNQTRQTLITSDILDSISSLKVVRK